MLIIFFSDTDIARKVHRVLPIRNPDVYGQNGVNFATQDQDIMNLQKQFRSLTPTRTKGQVIPWNTRAENEPLKFFRAESYSSF